MTQPAEEVLGRQTIASLTPPAPIELELPWEVKHRFRTKALTLGTLETWVVLGLAFAFDNIYDVDRKTAMLITFSCLVCAAVSLGFFWWKRHAYPVNYLLLLITTLLAGTFWAYTENSIFVESVKMPIQVNIIMAVMITTWLVVVQVPNSKYEKELLSMGLVMGWFAGAGADVIYVQLTDLPIQSVVPPITGVLLSTVVILVAVARPMLRCCADDYMVVAMALTANLFLLVSVPVVMMLMAMGGGNCSCDGMDSSENQQGQEQPPPTPEVPEAAAAEPAPEAAAAEPGQV